MRELPDRPSLEHYRREAKELVRVHRAGEGAARERAVRVLGERGRFLLSDAQFVLAREHGFGSWAELRRAVESSPLDALAAVERGEIVVDSGLAYGDGEPVQILVRKRLLAICSPTRAARLRRPESRPAGTRRPSGLPSR